MKKLTALAVALIMGMAVYAGPVLTTGPDFAFPKTVISNADSVLAVSRDPGLRMQALMQKCVALQSIDPDSAFVLPGLVAKYADQETDEVYRGLMKLYQARLLANIYSQESYAYNRVAAPLEPVPADIALWSGDQFRNETKRLLAEAGTTLAPHGTDSLKTYAPVVEIGANTLTFYPLLRDFVASASIDIANMTDIKGLSDSLRKEIFSLTVPGTPEWVAWIDEDDASELYKRFPNGLVGGVLLYKIPLKQGPNTGLVILLKNYLETEPENIITEALRDRLKFASRPQATLEAPYLAYPGQKIDLKVSGYWLSNVEILIYRQKRDIYIRNFWPEPNEMEKVDSLYLTFDGSVPEVNDSITITAPDDGTYYLTINVDGVESNNWVSVNVTSYLPFLVNQCGRYGLALVKTSDGSPVKKAKVYFNDKNGGQYRLGVTDADGLSTFTVPSGLSSTNGYLSIAKQNITNDFERLIGVYVYQNKNIKNEVAARFFTDRPVYHPGDTVSWSLVLSRYDGQQKRAALCPGTDIKVALYDANFMKVDSVSIVTDSTGRASGYFVAPVDRLAGNYRLKLEETTYTEIPSTLDGWFMVSDFKIPQFEIKDFSATVCPDGSISVSGDAITFSGMPVIDANVSVTMEPRVIWRFYSSDREEEIKSAILSGTTDAAGHFILLADTTQITKGVNYQISATVTDKAANIASASAMVRADNHLYFSFSSDGLLNVDSGYIPQLCVVDAAGTVLDETADWQLINKSGDIVTSGTCALDSRGASINLSEVPAGKYLLALRSDNNQRLQPDTINIITYSIKRNKVPSEITLLIPDQDIKAPAHGTTTFLVGVSRKTSVYIFKSSTSTLLSAERCELSPGFHKIATPEAEPRASYSVLFAVPDGINFFTKTVNVVCENTEAMKVSVESWRDNLLPGSRETITLKFSAPDGTPVNANAVATLYNAALDKLYRHKFKPYQAGDDRLFPNYNPIESPMASSHRLRNYINWVTYNSYYGRSTSGFSIDFPTFLYSLRFGSLIYCKVAMPTMAASRSANGAVLMDVEQSEDEIVINTAAGYSEPEISYDGTAEDDLRKGEIMQAFWRPDLVSREDGSVTITYTVPNSNGTWHFLAMAWNEALYAASIDKTAISSKPIMVQPSLPRFLRRGDTVTLMATIYNKTSEPAEVNYTIEIFDPSTRKVISCLDSVCHLDAMGSAVVQIDGVGTVDTEAIGYRVKAYTDVYSDGEQNLIPVLDSGMTVFDSSTFYLTEANPVYRSTVPDATGARNVLDYCGNPVWDVVKALPALYDRNPRTGFAAARAIYGALTARGLAGRFPEIPRAIQIWQENPADSALVSDLYKNESIKNMMLQQTPWEWAAADNTSRMERLSLTFNPAEIEQVLDRGIAALESLQQPDGGFAWGSWSSRSDLYTTESILSVLGHLSEQGFLDGNARLDSLINRAFEYVDSKVKPDDSRYAYIVTLFSGREPATDNARAALRNGVSEALKTWKRSGNVTKASMALMLNETGYNTEARNILNSIRQFEVKSPLAGISFPSVNDIDGYSVILRAFAKIDPQAAELDAMRQWLVLRSQSTDDLGSWNPTSLISAILSTGSRWTTLRAAQAPVSLAGHSLPISEVESVAGSFSVVLPSDAAGRSLEITRPVGAGVSYGSITSVYTAPMETVEARSSDAVEVTKRFLVADGDGWRETTAFMHGDRVKVQITLRVKREMEYLTIVDDRPAAFEPVEQMPGYVYADGLRMYREVDDSRTCLFVDDVVPGVYTFSYDMTAATAGDFASGPVTVQSQYAPELNARSGSTRINVKL